MRKRSMHKLLALLLVWFLLANTLPAALQAAPLSTAPHATTATTIEIPASEDAGVVESIPTFNGGGVPYFVLNSRPGGDFDYNFIKFDLSVIPADATVSTAQLKLNVNAVANANDIEIGRVNGDWQENTITWNSKPGVTWSGVVRNAAAVGDVTWPLKPLLVAWLNGTQPNHGVALVGKTPNTGGVRADSRDGLVPPRLVVTYSVPVDGNPRPDLGDAPDSSNHHGINNTAYAAGGGVPGRFPTVWETPAGQPAGPRHANQTMEGWLGDVLSREAEADLGPDQDGPNNILRNAAGVVGDVADKDRGDDGWRNRTIRFFDCQRTTLDVRVSKAASATRAVMYLNVWFDGNRDGDWQDRGLCQRTENEPAQASNEWIVQNHVVDMASIAAGGARTFSVNTEKVLNGDVNKPHWIRFTLSEVPAVQPASGDFPDGRGPHPTSSLGHFKFGETEDVLQKPTPAGEDGVLELEKSVLVAGELVDWLDTVTYEIRLRHNGGSQPIQAQIRDVLPYPLALYPTIDASGVHFVIVDSPTGGATPLLAQLDTIPPTAATPPQQVVSWQGSLAPNAEVRLRFLVRVLTLCAADQQTQTIRNVAQARRLGGPVISDEVSFIAKCLGYSEENLDFETVPMSDVTSLDDLAHLPLQVSISNHHPFTVSLGIFQLPAAGAVVASELDAENAAKPRFLDRVTLAGNQDKLVDLELRLRNEFSGELSLPDDYSPTVNLGYCLLPGEQIICPNAQLFPHLNGALPPIAINVRPNDLGDAPDSSNHPNQPMLAYPGVQAAFPTVFDPATGMPQGPRHSYPRPFHLGQRVSLEAEADMGPDQDPLNNIEPVANDPDNDRRDDGTNFALWNLANCQTTNLPVQVAISPQAVAHFQQLGTPAYLNIWLDSNRNGQWAEAAQCGQQPAPEHIVIDRPVNVVALGAGLHVINAATGLVPWSAANQPAWVRITLSERPSNKTLMAGGVNYGDGRGHAQPFKTGETEDSLYYPAGADGGPDLAVQLAARSRKATGQEPGLQAAAVENLGNFEIQMFKIDYENRGSQSARGALLEFQIPERLRGVEPILLRAPGVTSESISFNFDRLGFALPDLTPGDGGSIILGWYGCITCTVAAANAELDYNGKVIATLPGDSNMSNNESSATARSALSPITIGAFMDYTDDACMDHVVSGLAATNRTNIALRGKAAPNQIIAILIGLLRAGTVTSDANGNFSYLATLKPGDHTISARYAGQLQSAATAIFSPRDPQSGLPTGQIRLHIDPSLPFDPMSVCFTDRRGQSFFVPTLGYSFGATQTGSWLRSGGTYSMTVNATAEAYQYFKVTFEDVLVSSLTDPDNNGTFQGEVTFPNGVQAADLTATGKLGLLVGRGSTESSYSTQLTSAVDGVISDITNGQPLANSTVAALVGQTASDESAVYSLWSSSESGQVNPQVTDATGTYGYSAVGGVYRLDIARSGYQPYRTADIEVNNGVLARNIALTPQIDEAATQTIYIDEEGFTPAAVRVQPGAVIEFVNIGLGETGVLGAPWRSGVLAPGASYKVKLTTTGDYYFQGGDGLAGAMQISVDATVNTIQVYLPLINR